LSSILGVGCLFPLSSRAIDETIVLRGTVTVAPGVEWTSSSASSSGPAALYLTCRPDKPDNVPAAILNGSRGKPPPVLAARIENPSFPLDWSLSSPRDLTVEGAPQRQESLEFANDDLLWWKQDDLIVSARWDSDGVAATRSPNDLVGRAIWKNGDEKVQVQLTGRGAFGKYATGSKK
jgi:hypothetical protein